MPKIKKVRQGNKNSYTEEALQKALSEIKSGSSKKTIAKKYGIPRSTLQFRLSSKFRKVEKGPNTYLTQDEEAKLASWIIESHKKGFPRRKEDIQASVKYFLDNVHRANPFKDNRPGKHWYDSYLKRHPHLVHRTTEAVTSASANVSESDIRKWFEGIEDYLMKKDYFSILEDPSRVFNGDETCFLFCPKLGKVVAPVGAKNVYEVDQGEAKQNLTVMFTFSAAGEITPPMIIYPNKRLSANVSKSIPDEWGIGLSENGWMKAEVFVDYIERILYPYLIKKGVQFPIVLFLDGHKTHLTYEVSTLCSNLQIILIALYPNATRILQPADVSSFKPLKNGWRNAVLEWRRLNPYVKLGKEHFAPILEKVVGTLSSSVIRKGFEACGLFPWNPNRIDFSKCLGKENKNTVDDNIVSNTESVIESKKVLNFEDFLNIVGKDKINELRNEVVSHTCEYSNLIRELLSYFDRVPQNTVVNISDKNFNNNCDTDNVIIEVSDADINFTEEEMCDMPIDLIDIDNNNGLLDGIELPYNDKIIIHDNTKIASPRSSPYAFEEPVKIQYNKVEENKILNYEDTGIETALRGKFI